MSHKMRSCEFLWKSLYKLISSKFREDKRVDIYENCLPESKLKRRGGLEWLRGLLETVYKWRHSTRKTCRNHSKRRKFVHFVNEIGQFGEERDLLHCEISRILTKIKKKSKLQLEGGVWSWEKRMKE